MLNFGFSHYFSLVLHYVRVVDEMCLIDFSRLLSPDLSFSNCLPMVLYCVALVSNLSS